MRKHPIAIHLESCASRLRNLHCDGATRPLRYPANTSRCPRPASQRGEDVATAADTNHESRVGILVADSKTERESVSFKSAIRWISPIGGWQASGDQFADLPGGSQAFAFPVARQFFKRGRRLLGGKDEHLPAHLSASVSNRSRFRSPTQNKQLRWPSLFDIAKSHKNAV